MGKLFGVLESANFFIKIFFVGFIFWLVGFILIRTIYPQETTLNVIQESATILGGVGIFFAAIQAFLASKTYKYNSTPIVLHTGFFDFFDSDDRPVKLELIQFKNVGERLCYNIRGWCINRNNLYRLVFGEVIKDPTQEQTEEQAQQIFRADYQRVWMEKNNIVNTTINKPHIATAPDSVDHIILLYDDNEGRTYYSLLTRSYKYSTGFLSLWQRFKICTISRMSYFKFIHFMNLVSET